LLPWACLVLVLLKLVELSLQIKAGELIAAMVGPTIVLKLIAGVHFLKQNI